MCQFVIFISLCVICFDDTIYINQILCSDDKDKEKRYHHEQVTMSLGLEMCKEATRVHTLITMKRGSHIFSTTQGRAPRQIGPQTVPLTMLSGF